MLNFYNGKKVFITGHTGFKGSWLSKILIMAGAKVAGYALKPEGKDSLFNLLNLSDSMDSIIGDIRDYDKLYKAINDFKPDIIFHLAAQPLVRESYNKPKYTFDVNVMGTVNVLEVVRNCEFVKSLVNITTDKVYMNKEWEWGYRENERLCGFDPYSNSKSCSELVTYSYNKSFFDNNSNISISTARSGNVIGGGDFAKDRIIPDCVRAACEKRNIIVRNPNSIRPYQHVLDCLNGYLILAEKQYNNKEISGNYNFGPNEESCITTGCLATTFCDLWKDNLKWITKDLNGPHEANFLKLDCSKSKKYLEWHPKLNIYETLTYVVEWYKCYNNKENIEEITERQIINFFKENNNE